jgi:H+/Cl- antiporter ClcA
MNFWIHLWTIVFFASLAIFAGLAVIVTVGGFFNIRSLLKSLATQPDRQEGSPRAKDDEPT